MENAVSTNSKMTTPNSGKPADYLSVAGRHQSVTFPRHVKHASIGVRTGNHILIYNSSIIPKKTHSFGKQPPLLVMRFAIQPFLLLLTVGSARANAQKEKWPEGAFWKATFNTLQFHGSIKRLAVARRRRGGNIR